MKTMGYFCFSLETGGLIIGITSLTISIFFHATCDDSLEVCNVNNVKNSPIIGGFLDGASQHVLTIVYTILALCEILWAVLFIAGIVMHKYFKITGISKYLLVPWIVDTALIVLIWCIEEWKYLYVAVIVFIIFGFMFYTIVCTIALFEKFREEETADTGVQMVHINESNTTIPLPPYTIMRSNNNKF